MKSILALSGGGSRGIIEAAILAQIEAQTGKRIQQLFDVFAGTSTGGLIALLLNIKAPDGSPKYTATDILALYKSKLPQIFANPRVLSSIVQRPKYEATNLEAVALELCGSATMADLYKPTVVTAFDTVLMSPVFITSNDEGINGMLVRDAARATSAAPTYFEPKQVTVAGRTYCLIDGCMSGNNSPGVCGYTFARKLYGNSCEEEFIVVSVTAGHIQDLDKASAGYSYDTMKTWGVVQWILGASGSPILSMLLESSDLNAHEKLLELLPRNDDQNYDRYYKLSVPLPQSKMVLDNITTSHLQFLENEALGFVSAQQTYFNAMYSILTMNMTEGDVPIQNLSGCTDLAAPPESNWVPLENSAFSADFGTASNARWSNATGWVGFPNPPQGTRSGGNFLRIDFPRLFLLSSIKMKPAANGNYIKTFEIDYQATPGVSSLSPYTEGGSTRVFTNTAGENEHVLANPKAIRTLLVWPLSTEGASACRIDFEGYYA